MEASQIQSRINAIVAELQSLSNAIGGSADSSAINSEATKKLSQGICFYCEKKLGKQAKISRGCHSHCAQKIRRRIKEGKITDAEAVTTGLWAERQQGGRPVSDDNVFAAIARTIEVESLVKKTGSHSPVPDIAEAERRAAGIDSRPAKATKKASKSTKKKAQ